MRAMRRAAGFAAAGLLAAVLAGCGKSGSSSVAPTIPMGTVDDLVALVRQAFVSGAVVPTNVDANVSVLLYTLEVDGRRGATAFFVDQTTLGQTLVNAGDVSVHPVAGSPLSLTQHVLSVTGAVNTVYTTFISRPLGVALPFDGTTFHRFTVTGSASVEAFTDSVTAVSAPAISAPASGATADSLVDLTVSWSNPGADSTVYVQAMLRSTVDTTSTVLSDLARDADGTTLIPSPRVRALPSGPARLSVARFRVRPRSVGARIGALVCESVVTRSIQIQ